ncbi:MAG: alpha-E domain-containing protein [Myxococcota bacterium]|nr:alpha-E domain-containing protein [Myxococcota bacterium]
MISRVADSCFWVARYLERVDTLARLLEVNVAFNLDVDLPSAERWRPLVVVAGQEEDFVARVGEKAIDDPEAVQDYLTWDAEQPSSILACLRWARENARTIREAMSVEMWESVNDAWLWMKGRPARRLYQADRASFYRHLSNQCMLFHGICYSTMLHEEPFLFMKLGRAVERVGQTARILDVKHHSLGDKPREEETTADAAQWLAILRSCSAFDPFFKRAANVLTGPSVAQFLIFDRTFPRSVLHNLDRTRGLMMRIRGGDPPALQRKSWDRLERFRGELVQLDIAQVQRLGIHKVLTWIVDTTAGMCEAIHWDYLDPPVDSLRLRVRQSQRPGFQRQEASVA